MACSPNCKVIKKNWTHVLEQGIYATRTGRENAKTIADSDDHNIHAALRAMGCPSGVADFISEGYFGIDQNRNPSGAAKDYWHDKFPDRIAILRHALSFALSFDRPVVLYWVSFPVDKDHDDAAFKVQVTDEGAHVAVHTITPLPDNDDTANQVPNRRDASWLFSDQATIDSQIGDYNDLLETHYGTGNFTALAASSTSVYVTNASNTVNGCSVYHTQLWSYDPNKPVSDDPSSLL